MKLAWTHGPKGSEGGAEPAADDSGREHPQRTSLEKLIDKYRLPDRSIGALFNAAFGLRVRRATYMATRAEMDEEISEQTATRDLQALVDSGQLVPFGERRGRFYAGSQDPRELGQMIAPRRIRDDTDPFAEAS